VTVPPNRRLPFQRPVPDRGTAHATEESAIADRPHRQVAELAGPRATAAARSGGGCRSWS